MALLGLGWLACFQCLYYWLNSFSQLQQHTFYWLITLDRS